MITEEPAFVRRDTAGYRGLSFRDVPQAPPPAGADGEYGRIACDKCCFRHLQQYHGAEQML